MARTCPNSACGKSYSDDASFCGECGSITIQQQVEGDVDPRLGERLGDYLVVARIADGAMGRVYEGRHHASRERVAVKVLHTEVARDGVAVERFKREYEAARDLAHPNIVKVIDFGTTPDGLSFMTMEFLEGEELGQLLRRGVTLTPERVVRVFCQLAIALEHAHSFGFIHRDLKPDNIFLCHGSDGDVVRILDFGSVKLQMDTGPKLTAFGTTLGSPYYMSPEQALGKQDVDQRSDVFALAAILYECLTGKIAFDAPSIAQILMKIINQQPVAPTQTKRGLPPRIDDVVERGLRKDKATRYASATAFANEVCEAYGLEPDVARWATTAATELSAALAATPPPPAQAYTTSSLEPVTSERVRRRAAAGSNWPMQRSRSAGMVIGVAVGALAVVALVAVLLLR